MNFNDDNFADEMDNQTQTEEKSKPNAYRVDNGAGLDEEDLEKTFLFGKGDDPSNPTEGKSTGGQKFGENNLTPAGDDKNNPSQNAGYNNAYLARTEPSDEHPEDSNFTAANQEGSPKPEKVERGNGENDRPHPQQPYTEGTVDNDGGDEPNIPGPNELPDQQKVGEDDDKDYIET